MKREFGEIPFRPFSVFGVRIGQPPPRFDGGYDVRSHSEAMLRDVHERLVAVHCAETYKYSVRAHLPSDRVMVHVPLSGGWAVSRLAATIDDPGRLIVVGSAAILDG